MTRVINACQSLIGLLLLTIGLAGTPLRAEDSLPALKDGKAARSSGT